MTETTPAKPFAAQFKKNLHFTSHVADTDPEVTAAIRGELRRQQDCIELIASENYASLPTIEAMGTVPTNKYAEGYPGKRYYGGCEEVDKLEEIAIKRACKLFDCTYANVQPHSGAQANEAVYKALLKPGDTLMGMKLAEGGHLTHGAPPTVSGQTYKAVQYGVNQETGLIDYDEVKRLALENKPKLIVAGASAYARQIDFRKFRNIVDELNEQNPGLNCKFMVDMAHYAGLVAGNTPDNILYESPLPYADVVTTTTHKTLRGPRGGMILSNKPEMVVEPAGTNAAGKKTKAKTLGEAINSAVFPGIQGGPLMHIIAAKAVSFGEALQPEFKEYARQVKANAQVLAKTLMDRSIKIVSDGTDSHMMLVDLRSLNPDDKPITGKDFEKVMERAGLTANKNGVPGDQEFIKTSGVRLGTPAGTSRGFGEKEFEQIGSWVADLVDALRQGKDTGELEQIIRGQVKEICDRFPIYEDNLLQIQRSRP